MGQKQKTEREKEKREKERKRPNNGNNNGQATHGARKHAWRTQARMAHASRLGQFYSAFWWRFYEYGILLFGISGYPVHYNNLLQEHRMNLKKG